GAKSSQDEERKRIRIGHVECKIVVEKKGCMAVGCADGVEWCGSAGGGVRSGRAGAGGGGGRVFDMEVGRRRWNLRMSACLD
ncbi:hypothetical protein Tco_1335081, partial [Tanacetum coccineum]